MKRLIAVTMLLAVLGGGCAPVAEVGSASGGSAAGDQILAKAYSQHLSGVRVSGVGIVTKILPDDNSGGRHQRFILRLASGQTLLVAHNIDIAPRLVSLKVGASVEFSGVYEWNSSGGVLHWTHRDPSGGHPAGWLKYDGVTSQ